MRHFEALVLAVGALILSSALEVGAQVVRGMMWTEWDHARPVAMMLQPEPLKESDCKGCYVIASNLLQQTDHGALEGYFAVGQAFDGMLRPADPRFHWLSQFRNKPVDIIIRVREERKLETIK